MGCRHDLGQALRGGHRPVCVCVCVCVCMCVVRMKGGKDENRSGKLKHICIYVYI